MITAKIETQTRTIEVACNNDKDHAISSLQNAVGGYIQTFYGIDYPCCIVCNDEAKINGMSLPAL